MKTWEHSGFQVYAGEPIAGDDENARLFLGRYLKKSPASLERIHLKDTLPEPSVVYFKQRDDGDERYRTSSPLEFLAELQQHLPDRWEQTSRFFGCYASRTRGAEARKKRLRERLESLHLGVFPPPEQEPAPAWQISD